MAGIWKERPEAHDYPAAVDYLTLLMEEKAAKKLVNQLRKAPTIHKKAKDLLRASRLPLLPRDNIHVAGDLKKIKKGKAMSPVLLVRGNAMRDLPLVVADGFTVSAPAGTATRIFPSPAGSSVPRTDDPQTRVIRRLGQNGRC